MRVIRKVFIVAVGLITLLEARAQFPIDTTFTPYSTLIKERKRFPDIEIVRPENRDESRWRKDIIYYTIEDSPYGRRELQLDLFLPGKKGKKRPAVILIHGGGWNSGNKSHMFPMAQRFSDAGYVAIAVEYRLSNEAAFPAAVVDIKQSVRWLRSHGKELGVDPEKVAILGCSAGAQMAALVGMTPEDSTLDVSHAEGSCAVNAIVSMDGIVSFIHPEADAEGAAAARWLSGSRETNYENWKRASPSEYLTKRTPPIGFVNSSIPRFHAGRDDLIQKMNEFGIYTEVHTIPDTPHPFWLLHPWFETASDYSLDFLNKVFNRK